MQSHIIFGAGLIGSFLGGVLSTLETHTRLVCRPHIKQKLREGLLLTDYQEHQLKLKTLDFIDPVEMQANTKGKLHCDFLWITVKCTGIEQAGRDIRPLVGPETVILCCQNGLGSDHIIKQQYPDNVVLRIMVAFNVSEPKPGHLHRGSEGGLHIETAAQQSIITTLAESINTAIMPVYHTTEMDALVWAKLQLNLGNSVNALANIPVKPMLQQRAYRLVIANLMKELLTVTKALYIKLPKITAVPATMIPVILSLPNVLFNLVANKMLAIDPTVRTSMWWDLSQGKKTEIEYLNGAIIQAADLLKIDCPVNKRIIAMIHRIEQTQKAGQREGIDGKKLLQEIRQVQ